MIGGDETMEWLDAGDGVLALRRSGEVTVMVNFGPEPVAPPVGEVVLASGELRDGRLPPDTAVWVR
jgi:alpha-glucosidase